LGEKGRGEEVIDTLIAQIDAIGGKFKEIDVQIEQLRKAVKVLENTVADLQRRLEAGTRKR